MKEKVWYLQVESEFSSLPWMPLCLACFCGDFPIASKKDDSTTARFRGNNENFSCGFWLLLVSMCRPILGCCSPQKCGVLLQLMALDFVAEKGFESRESSF
ncbi:MAG: hypothetical protein ACR2PX_15250 [Endozoicomonas sp.]|uniref:hypothetical protein n=1 Tax=Endozoicomonas sp. TaxID=1892382 RepID=UPI003D9AEF7A